MSDQSQPTRLASGGDPSPQASFTSIEEGRFPAGTTLAGRFRILGLLGTGGMGEVYRALDLTLNQPVALKFVAHSEQTSEAALVRFRNEVRIARQVSHPNVCRVYDIGAIEGMHFLSMEYVDGEDLSSLLRRIGRLPSDKALEFARRICAGLTAAHERGVLHRDLKPANIMIDGRGQVRITDFGLAALAGDVNGGEIRSGTPAYMSPEQKAGKEVTVRSDLYALGLVLHEMFTGKRPDPSAATPTSLANDLDPAIERVILRCLDPNPRARPASALHVAMALPGGDPIAAALAAGETPSPEMVAASAEKEGLDTRTAVACFVAIVLMLGALVLVANKTTLIGRAPLPLPPDALAFKAREMLKGLGYTEEPVDVAYGFIPSPFVDLYQRYLLANDAGRRWERLSSHRPALVIFWYRQHQRYLQPIAFLSLKGLATNSMVTPFDPPNIERGMINLQLNANGQLEYLEALPGSVQWHTPVPAVDWSSLFSAAGLDAARFATSTPSMFVPVFADSRMSWTGSYSEGRPDTIRVEAAALEGRPVFFRIIGPWQDQGLAERTASQQIADMFLGVLLVALLTASVLIARRNVRLGRGDKRAAWRVAGVTLSVGVVSWALVASHVPTIWELILLLNGLSWVALQAASMGLLYLAVEPFVRRYWPDALISWLRVVGGRFRDPLVTSHLLVGISAGLMLALLTQVTSVATTGFLNDPTGGGETASIVSLNGLRFFLGILLDGLKINAWIATGTVLLMVLLRSVARSTRVADVLFVVLLTLPWLPFPVGVPGVVLANVTVVWVIRRFGLLAIVAGACVSGAVQGMPLAAASWYAPLSLTTPILVAALAAWSVYVIATSQPGGGLRPASGPAA